MILDALISPITSLVSGIVGRNQEKDAEELKGNIQHTAHEDALKIVEEQQETEEIKQAGQYDLQALQNQIKDWGDDYLLIVMTLPFIAGFLPLLQPVVADGWVALQSAPIWYPTILIGITAAKFGLRWLFQRKP
jgi:hypothetical protein